MHVWLNGGIVEPADAHVGLDDHGLVVGGGAFETLKIVRGEAFAMRRHLARLGRTLDALAIPRPSDAVLRSAARDLIEASGLASARLRITVTGGKGTLGSGSPSGPPTTIAIVSGLSGPPPPTAITVPWTRNEQGALSGLKTTSYAENVRALHAAHEAGCGEALFSNTAGQLCEGTGTNVFVVVGDEVITPPLSSGCLPGITRELVTEVADIVERPVPIQILGAADEVFLTSSTRDVQGLTRIDDLEFAVGPVTERVAAAFADLVATDLDP
jgi:branched-chain amino acid aminotransferase